MPSRTMANPLNTDAASSLKNALIFYNYTVWNGNFSRTALIIRLSFFRLAPTSSHLHPLQAENCDSSNSRLVVDEDDDGKLG